MCSVNNFYESLQFWLHGVSKYSIKFTVHFHQFHYVSKESTLSLISHYFTLDWFFRISTYKPHTVETFHCSCIFPLLHTFFFKFPSIFSYFRPFLHIWAPFFHIRAHFFHIRAHFSYISSDYILHSYEESTYVQFFMTSWFGSLIPNYFTVDWF